LPHGKLTAIDTDILTVVGDIPMPVGDLKRRMTVVRLRDRRLVIQGDHGRGKAALAGQLRRWAELPSLRRILVSHGSPIERDAPQILHALARSLD